MREKKLNQLTSLDSIKEIMKELKENPSMELVLTEEGFSVNNYTLSKIKNNSVKIIESLLEIINLHERTLKHIYNQQKQVNISINYNDRQTACDVLYECQDFINSVLAMTNLEYEIKEPNIKFVDSSKHKVILREIGDLQSIKKILDNIKDCEDNE